MVKMTKSEKSEDLLLLRKKKLCCRKEAAEDLLLQMRGDFMLRKIYSDFPFFSYLQKIEAELEQLEECIWYKQDEYDQDNPFL